MKKFTKILSLALALALVLSTTAFAATTVYYIQDFSGYANIDALLKDIPHNATTPNAAIAVTMRNQGNNMFYRTGNAPASGLSSTAAAPTLEADASGVKWFNMFTNAEKAGASANLAIAPNSTWDYTANEGETYVISYDIKVAPQGTITSDQRQSLVTLWAADEEGTGGVEDGFFDIGRFTTSSSYGEGDADKIYARSYVNQNWYSALSHELTANVAHKMAVGYKVGYDKDNNKLAYPHKTMAVDGTVTAESSATGKATSATPKLVALKFTSGYYMGIAMANIRMYTIKNTDTLDVSRVGTGVVPTSNASVEVKFSQPVGKLDKTAVTVNGLTYGEDFTVSDVTDVATSTEVYSKATVNFTKELEGDATYTITFGDVTNEIGTAITGNTVSFTTDKAPTFDLEISGYEGLAAGTTQIAADAMAGKTVYFTATATNETGRAVNGTLAIGIYDAQGNLVKYAFANKAFADAGVNTFSAAFKLEAGQTAKAFVTGSNSVKVFGE